MSKIPGSAHVNLSLGGLVLAGGIVGYVKKGSRMSLISGITVGSLLLGSGYLIAKTDQVYEGHVLATTTSSILALAMGQRFMATGKFMPAGLVAALGVGACAYNYHKSKEWAPETSSSMKEE
ncbi:hypothetical protein FisN_30Lh096 [Fistulifera solaris]|uniref:Uncharacterized protein n=1 Tax=Fistulifera solaris TaxID=1519565 RepID=A0A1Z5JIY8_FISSO|nr:hypothetical protein FisN_30Lh096 [Fistulifera solaris]|eukprot:GAX13802.1 hypothetical protein FisN_30Lh096 [Fistulifera solaris]